MPKVPLEELLKKEMFDKDLVKKISEGVYRLPGVSLHGINVLSKYDYFVVVIDGYNVLHIMDSFMCTSIAKEEREIEVYAVHADQLDDFVSKVVVERKCSLCYCAKFILETDESIDECDDECYDEEEEEYEEDEWEEE